MTFKFTTVKTLAAGTLALMIALPVMAQGGNDPVPGIDIIIKGESIKMPVGTFSLTPDEIAKINSIKGPERLALILEFTDARIKAEPGFVKSGMQVMGKDWCGDCAWPKQIDYTFAHGKSVYRIDLTLAQGKGFVPVGGAALAMSKDGEDRLTENLSISSGNQNTDVTADKAAAGPIAAGLAAIATIVNDADNVGCVTVDGAVDTNCDGLADSAISSKRGEVKDARDRY